MKLPKIELHNHLEGTLPANLVRQLAIKNKMELPAILFDKDDTFVWNTFVDFHHTYDLASSVIRTPDDYREITYRYLASLASEGAIYAELTDSPDHAAQAGMSYESHLEGLIQGIKDAKRDFGIEARVIIVGVRHFGVEKVLEVAKLVAKHPNPYVVGFTLAGDEINFPPKQFAKAFQLIHEVGLGTTAHAGEAVGPEGVWEALKHLPITRLGHGIRIIEDEKLIETVKEKNITLECCPTSNIVLKIYENYQTHPLRKLFEKGVKITLNSDDPPFFKTTLGKEYDVAKKFFGFTDKELLELSRNAIHASFVDPETKKELLNKVDAFPVDKK